MKWVVKVPLIFVVLPTGFVFLIIKITVKRFVRYGCMIFLPSDELTVNQQSIRRVTTYTYLGTNINEQWDQSLRNKTNNRES